MVVSEVAQIGYWLKRLDNFIMFEYPVQENAVMGVFPSTSVNHVITLPLRLEGPNN